MDEALSYECVPSWSAQGGSGWFERRSLVWALVKAMLGGSAKARLPANSVAPRRVYPQIRSAVALLQLINELID